MSALHQSIAVPFLVETVAFLLTVVIIVPTLRRLGVSPILGYLAVGTAIGPHALAWVSDVKAVQHFAELGVVFLLFTIGLDLTFYRLKEYARLIFCMGLLQVLLCAGAIGGLAYAWGNAWQASSIIGLCLALSSTAMVMQLLGERGEIATSHGRTAFAVLLFQDLAVVPILILVSILGASAEPGSATQQQSHWAISLLQALAALTFILIFGRYVLSHLFRVVARTGNTDVFTALTLLVILATSMITGMAGLSLALGAFLAGLVLAETEFRYQIESEIEPFKGLFLGLFFMGVGMNVSIAVAFERGVWVILAVLGLLAIKTAIVFVLARIFGLKSMDALHTALLLAQGGEFAFVVIGQATLTYPLLTFSTGQFMVVVAGISMALTPLLAILARYIRHRVDSRSSNAKSGHSIDQDLQHHCIIAGYGRVGKIVARVLTKNQLPYIALDAQPDRVKQEHEAGAPVYLGDVTRVELLKRAGANRAESLVLTLNSPQDALKTVQTARRHWPNLNIIVRTHDAKHAVQLSNAGASAVILETLESSLEISGRALEAFGLSTEQARLCMDSARKEQLLLAQSWAKV